MGVITYHRLPNRHRLCQTIGKQFCREHRERIVDLQMLEIRQTKSVRLCLCPLFQLTVLRIPEGHKGEHLNIDVENESIIDIVKTPVNKLCVDSADCQNMKTETLGRYSSCCIYDIRTSLIKRFFFINRGNNNNKKPACEL